MRKREKSMADTLTSTENTPERWSHALQFYQEEASTQERNNSNQKVVFNCVIDVSSSMEGTRLTSVKNGICAVMAGLKDDDLINISSFSDRIRTLTNGFQQVRIVREALPRYLSALHVSGSTALYDAVVDGVKKLRDLFEDHKNQQNDEYKYALLVLTDGEDTSSRRSNDCVLRYLASPGISKFMVILIAVEMKRTQEQMFESWTSMRHCKQISVNIRSGKKLVQIFGEALMDRILNSDSEGSRFYNCIENETPYEETTDPTEYDGDEDYDSDIGRRSPVHLSAGLLRTLDNHSPSVSRAVSENGSDFGDSSFNDIGSEDDGTPPRHMRRRRSGRWSPSSPVYEFTESSHTLSSPSLPPFDLFDASYTDATVFNPLVRSQPGSPRRLLNTQGERIFVDEVDITSTSVDSETASTTFTNCIFSPSLSRQKRSFQQRTRSNSVSSQDVTTPSVISDDGSATPMEMICPISHEIMNDPVLCSDGQTYDRSSIEEWIRSCNDDVKSPLTGKKLESINLVPNHALRSLIQSTSSSRQQSLQKDTVAEVTDLPLTTLAKVAAAQESVN